MIYLYRSHQKPIPHLNSIPIIFVPPNEIYVGVAGGYHNQLQTEFGIDDAPQIQGRINPVLLQFYDPAQTNILREFVRVLFQKGLISSHLPMQWINSDNEHWKSTVEDFLEKRPPLPVFGKKQTSRDGATKALALTADRNASRDYYTQDAENRTLRPEHTFHEWLRKRQSRAI